MTKRALLIGINYIGTENELQGCINDVLQMKELLKTKFNYQEANITLLSDDPATPPSLRPTNANIKSNLSQMVSKTKPNDTFFLHYSGHGSQVQDLNGDERYNTDARGYDSCICPVDFADYNGTDGFIIDDYLKEQVVNKIPKGAKMRCFLDCCHSGSGLDLEYIWKSSNLFTISSKPEKQSDDIICISGCKDNSTSADTYNRETRKNMGALTMYIIKSLGSYPKIKITWKELVIIVRNYLAANSYEQVPMLSLSNKALSKYPIDI